MNTLSNNPTTKSEDYNGAYFEKNDSVQEKPTLYQPPLDTIDESVSSTLNGSNMDQYKCEKQNENQKIKNSLKYLGENFWNLDSVLESSDHGSTNRNLDTRSSGELDKLIENIDISDILALSRTNNYDESESHSELLKHLGDDTVFEHKSGLECANEVLSLASTDNLILRNKLNEPYEHLSVVKELKSNVKPVPIYTRSRKAKPILPPMPVMSEVTTKFQYTPVPKVISRPSSTKSLKGKLDSTGLGHRKQFLDDLTKSIVDSEIYFKKCLSELNKCAAKVVLNKDVFGESLVTSSEEKYPSTSSVSRNPLPRTQDSSLRSNSIPQSTFDHIVTQEQADAMEKSLSAYQERQSSEKRRCKEDLTSLISKLKFLASYKKNVVIRTKRKSKVAKDKLEMVANSKRKEDSLSNNNFEDVLTQMEFETTNTKRQNIEIKNSVKKVVEWKRTLQFEEKEAHETVKSTKEEPREHFVVEPVQEVVKEIKEVKDIKEVKEPERPGKDKSRPVRTTADVRPKVEKLNPRNVGKKPVKIEKKVVKEQVKVGMSSPGRVARRIIADEETRLLSSVTPAAVTPLESEYAKQRNNSMMVKDRLVADDTRRRIEWSLHKDKRDKKPAKPEQGKPNVVSMSDMQCLQNLIVDPNARYKTSMTIMPILIQKTNSFTTKDVAEKPFEHQAKKRIDLSSAMSTIKSPIRAYIKGKDSKDPVINSPPKATAYKHTPRVDTKRKLIEKNVVPSADKNIILKEVPEKPLEKNIKTEVLKRNKNINNLIDDILTLSRPPTEGPASKVNCTLGNSKSMVISTSSHNSEGVKQISIQLNPKPEVQMLDSPRERKLLSVSKNKYLTHNMKTGRQMRKVTHDLQNLVKKKLPEPNNPDFINKPFSAPLKKSTPPMDSNKNINYLVRSEPKMKTNRIPSGPINKTDSKNVLVNNRAAGGERDSGISQKPKWEQRESFVRPTGSGKVNRLANKWQPKIGVKSDLKKGVIKSAAQKTMEVERVCREMQEMLEPIEPKKDLFSDVLSALDHVIDKNTMKHKFMIPEIIKEENESVGSNFSIRISGDSSERGVEVTIPATAIRSTGSCFNGSDEVGTYIMQVILEKVCMSNHILFDQCSSGSLFQKLEDILTNSSAISSYNSDSNISSLLHDDDYAECHEKPFYFDTRFVVSQNNAMHISHSYYNAQSFFQIVNLEQEDPISPADKEQVDSAISESPVDSLEPKFVLESFNETVTLLSLEIAELEELEHETGNLLESTAEIANNLNTYSRSTIHFKFNNYQTAFVYSLGNVFCISICWERAKIQEIQAKPLVAEDLTENDIIRDMLLEHTLYIQQMTLDPVSDILDDGQEWFDIIGSFDTDIDIIFSQQVKNDFVEVTKLEPVNRFSIECVLLVFYVLVFVSVYGGLSNQPRCET